MGACVLVCSKDPRNLSDKQKKYIDHPPNQRQIRTIAQELENPPQKTHVTEPSTTQEKGKPTQLINQKKSEENCQSLLQGSLTGKKSRFCPDSLKTSTLTSTLTSRAFVQNSKEGRLHSKEISTLSELSNQRQIRPATSLIKTSKKNKENCHTEKIRRRHDHHDLKEDSTKEDFVPLNKLRSRKRINKTEKSSNSTLREFSGLEAPDSFLENSETDPIVETIAGGVGQNKVRCSITKDPQYLEHHLIPNFVLNYLTPIQESLALQTLNFKTSQLLNQEIYYEDGIHYIGQWRSGMKEGKGKLVWKEGVYEGLWKKDQMEGHGKIIFSNGQIYEGSFKENKAEGDGTFYFGNGSVYRGQWKHNKENGFGVHEWPNNEYYQGNWEQGTKTGKGQLIFADGSYYKGQFSKNEWHGQGEYEWYNKQNYKGMWQHNKKAGVGILTFALGGSYQGQFQEDKYHGYGKLIQNDGRVSMGTFNRGRKEGYFEELTPEGEKKRGYWSYSKLLFYEDEVDDKQKEKILKKLERNSSIQSSNQEWY